MAVKKKAWHWCIHY